MSKKTFSGGLDSLLGGNGEKPREASPGAKPEAIKKKTTKAPKEKTEDKETRATFIINETTLTKLKAIAYWDRVLIKDVINEALETHVKKYEKIKGEIKPTPGRK
jgi:hypothetical protein